MVIEKRKDDHIKICLEKEVESGDTGFKNISFIHNALPEINFDEIDVSTKFLGEDFKAPFLITAITGGGPNSEKINKNLAKAAEELGIGMGLGSQRAMIENPDLKKTFWVRDVAPNIFLLGNLGAAQILQYEINKIKKAVEDIKADGLAIHLNPAQEVIQPEGDKNWSGVLNKIKEVCFDCDFPIIVKEVGCGISEEVAKKLENAGVAAIDIAGKGGTSWIKVEGYRGSELEKTLAKTFEDWGIQTVYSLVQCKEAVKIPIIASGGIRNGLEAAKALALGASLVGMALPLLKPATQSSEAVKKYLEKIILELKVAMFLVGAKDLNELKKVKIIMKKE